MLGVSVCVEETHRDCLDTVVDKRTGRRLHLIIRQGLVYLSVGQYSLIDFAHVATLHQRFRLFDQKVINIRQAGAANVEDVGKALRHQKSSKRAAPLNDGVYPDGSAVDEIFDIRPGQDRAPMTAG